MVRKTEYDFLAWTSSPSSAKLINDEAGTLVNWELTPSISVVPGIVPIHVMSKFKNILKSYSGFIVYGWDGKVWRQIGSRALPLGTRDWGRDWEIIDVIPGISAIQVLLQGGSGTPEAPGITWFDDLKVYQDDVLIYSNDFSNWNPFIGAGVGAPIGGIAGYLLKEPLGPMVSEVVGAVLGGALGGGVGLLTGLGIIPVPQIPIPTFGATPEEPGAPMRLGKYQITG